MVGVGGLLHSPASGRGSTLLGAPRISLLLDWSAILSRLLLAEFEDLPEQGLTTAHVCAISNMLGIQNQMLPTPRPHWWCSPLNVSNGGSSRVQCLPRDPGFNNIF